MLFDETTAHMAGAFRLLVQAEAELLNLYALCGRNLQVVNPGKGDGHKK